VKQLTALFDACFRIQREASEAAGHHVPMVVENVRGAIPWVGRSRWNFGSFHLWGDVPALMPIAQQRPQKFNPDGTSHPSGSWFAIADSKNRGSHRKISEAHRSKSPAKGYGAVCQETGIKQGGQEGAKFTLKKKGDKSSRRDPVASTGSKSQARKAASATIAKIPLPLSKWIASVYHPGDQASEVDLMVAANAPDEEISQHIARVYYPESVV
jgi:hypothetical protein